MSLFELKLTAMASGAGKQKSDAKKVVTETISGRQPSNSNGQNVSVLLGMKVLQNKRTLTRYIVTGRVPYTLLWDYYTFNFILYKC